MTAYATVKSVIFGLVVAAAIIVLANFAQRLMETRRHGRWSSCALFAVCAVGMGAGAFVEERWWLRLAYALISGILVYATFATPFEWPGFRPPADEQEEGDPRDV